MPLFTITEMGQEYITDDPQVNLFERQAGALVFPNNIGQSYQGHYMVINIYKPKTGGYIPSTTTSNFENPLNTDINQVDAQENPDSLSVYEAAKKVARNYANITTNPNLGLTQALSTTDAPVDKNATIVLAMPQNNLLYSSRNNYDNVALTYIGANGIAGFASGVVGAFLGAAAGAGLYSISNAAGRALGQAATLAGFPINPRLEILFTGREQRQFVFEILMSPVNEAESKSIQTIVRTLRYHSSPGIGENLGGEKSPFTTFIPPSSFQISFFQNGKENVNIPKIKRCALEEIQVDYSPSGAFSTFSTGQPVQVRLSLGFREINVLTKQDFGANFDDTTQANF